MRRLMPRVARRLVGPALEPIAWRMVALVPHRALRALQSRMARTRSFLAVALGLFAVGCGAAAAAPAAGGPPAAPPPTVQANAQTTRVTQPPYTASVSLPQLSWPGHAAQAAAVNAAVQAWAKGQEQAFAQAVATDLAHARNLPSTLPESNLTITYRVSLLNSHFLSYRFLVEPMFRGAANAAQTPAGLTFDLATGNGYTLASLFRSGGSYVTTLTSAAGAGLAAFSPAGARCYLGKPPAAIAASFSAWWLSPQGLVLSFPAGRYTASYCGPPTITVPYTALHAEAAVGSPLLGAV